MSEGKPNMESALRLIIVTVASLALASIGHIAEESTFSYTTEIQAEVKIVEDLLPICPKPETPEIHAEVITTHPTFITANFTTNLPENELRYYPDSFRLEQYIDSFWQDMPIPHPHPWNTSSELITFRTSPSRIFRFSHQTARPEPLPIGQYRILQAIYHHCPCGDITPYEVYATFAIVEELDEFELILAEFELLNISIKAIVGEVIGFYSGAFNHYGDWYWYDYDEIPFDAILLRFMFNEGHEDDEDDVWGWLINSIYGVWLTSSYIVARDESGTSIDPANIPIGSIIAVRGFFHRLLEGYPMPMDFHWMTPRMIEIIE